MLNLSEHAKIQNTVVLVTVLIQMTSQRELESIRTLYVNARTEPIVLF